MSNLEKAVKVADRLESEVMAANNYSSPPNPREYINALDKEGLIAPDLPEPVSVRESRTAAWFDGDVYTHEGSGKIRVIVEDSRYPVESARELALSILAACEYAERDN